MAAAGLEGGPGRGRIRLLTREEHPALLRFLDRGFGCGYDYFRRSWTHVYAEEAFDLSRFYVYEIGDRIVGHVGLTELEIHWGVAVVPAGGIGGVTTDPDYRNQGIMTALLNHVIAEMGRLALPISVLGGDRKRYGRFGWEYAGEKLEIHLTSAYLEELNIETVALSHVSPHEAADRVREAYVKRPCWIRRHDVLRHLAREDYDVWVTADGYVCGQIEGRSVTITELYSASSKELELVTGVLAGLGGRSEATVVMGARDPRKDRLLEAASWWRETPNYSFRINNSETLMKTLQPELSFRVRGDGKTDTTVRIIRPAGSETLRLETGPGLFQVAPTSGPPDVQLSWREWTRLVFGGPIVESARSVQRSLGDALPAGIFLGNLDHI